MDNKLNYQQARTVRKQSLRDVIADELIRGKGFGSAVTGAIGLKTQARIKGIKEKFDPLNIVKFLTFGSRLGPALYGKLFGRSKKDIEYFTGRAKPIGRKDQKLNKDGTDDEEDTAGMKAVLKQILTFMKKSHEQDVLLREEENNFKESNKLNDEKRHKELLKALGVVGTQQPTAIPVKEKKNGFLDDLVESIDNTVKGIKDKIEETIKSLEEKVKNFTDKIDDLILDKIKKFMAIGLLGDLLVFASLVAFEAYLFKKFQDLITADTDRRIDEFAKKGDIARTEAAIQSKNRLEDWSPLAINGGSQPDYDEAGTAAKVKNALQKQADLGSLEAKKALEKMDAEKQSKKDEYIKNLNLPANTPLNNAQNRDAELYSLGMIDLKGGYNPSDEERKFYQEFIKNFRNWKKPLPGEEEKNEFMKNAAKEHLIQIWRNLTAPGADTEDDVMAKKMFEVIKQNPLGPWYFDKNIPEYNEYFKKKAERSKQSPQSAVEIVQDLAALDQKQQEANDLKNSVAKKELNGTNTTTQPTVVSSARKQEKPNENIPMPLSRMIESSYMIAVSNSYA